MDCGSTHQNKHENKPEGLSKYVYKNFCYRQTRIIVHGIRDQLSGINLGRKHVMYQKLANVMWKKDVMAH